MDDNETKGIRPQLKSDIAESTSTEQSTKEAFDQGKQVGIEEGFQKGIDVALMSAAHELNSALTNVVGYIDLATEHANLSESERNYLNSAVDGALRASAIITNMKKLVGKRHETEQTGGVTVIPLTPPKDK